MQKTCPSCGADTFPGARFCRRCGAPQREDAGTADVSPRAATVPLAETEGRPADGRATEALAPEDGRPSADTARVSLSEMERLLRSQQDAAPNASDSARAYATHSAVTRPDAPADPDGEVTISVPRRAAADTRASAALDLETTIDAAAARDLDATLGVPYTTPHDALDDEELTLIASAPARAAVERPNAEDERPNVAGERAGAEDERANVGVAGASFPGPKANVASVRPTPPARRRWPVVVVVSAAVLLLAGSVLLVGYLLLRRAKLKEAAGDIPPAVSPVTPQTFDQKMAEAEALLAQGDMDGAVERLREANSIDGANWRAHYRLGELLIASGARREGIDELRAAARNSPDDLNVLRELAAALFAEGLYRESAEWYRRLVAVRRDAADPADLLAYADALRLSGRPEEARPIYQRVAAGATGDLAETARQRLGELAQSQPTPTPTPRAGEQPGSQQPREGESASLTQPGAQPTPAPTPAPTTQPTPQPTPAREEAATPEEHYRRGQGLWASDRGAALAEFREAAAGGDYDAHYYLGLSYVEGRSIHTLKRAEVVAALQHFQLAQRGRQYVAESRRYQQQLEKEFDRLRGQ